MPKQPVQTHKPVRKPATKKAIQAFRIADAKYGSPEGQAQMDAFLTSLTPIERSAVEHFLAVWKPGTPAWNDGYRKLFRFSKAWFGNQGKEVTLG